jgi:hypothetical protein
MQRDIQIEVKDRVARAVGQPVIVCGNCDYTVTFSFDDEWSEAGAKTARFKYLTAEGMKHIDKEFTDNVVQVPMLSNIREVEVGVYSADLATSTGAPIRCEPSVRCGSGEGEQDIVQSIIEATQEACRAELEESVETVTGESYDGKTWEELNDTVATLSTITEEQVQALGAWDLIKIYFESYRGNTHHLFRMAPKDTAGADKFYSLPYIYTPNMPWAADVLAFSSSLLEAGVDVSSAVNLGGGGTNRTFSPLPQLQRLTLTGNANNPSLYNFMSTNYELRRIKMETPSEAVLSANPSYYKRAFYRCERLETIDCELDFTGQTDTVGMFANCFALKDLRIKPFTLATSLDLGNCRSLKAGRSEELDEYADIIAVLNAITNDKEVAKNMTITFSGELVEFSVSSFPGSDYRYWSGDVWYSFDTGLYTLERHTEYGPVMPYQTPLEQAFCDKGVTLAWK